MDSLYTKALLRLASDAHGAGRLKQADARIDAASPICGDRIHLEIGVQGAKIIALAHETRACVLTQASMSMLAEISKGMDTAELIRAEAMIASWFADGPEPQSPFEGFRVFADLKQHPSRQACVLLPFKAAIKALQSII